jgi:hypothetical protein
MSTVQVDAINESTTNAGVTVDGVLIKDSKIGGTITVPSSTGTMALTSDISAGGLTEADQWCITADVSSSGVLTANWSRVSGTLLSYKGTGMTQSSGIFSFPSTGYWLIMVQAYLSSPTNGVGSAQINTVSTNDNFSSEDDIGVNRIYQSSYNNYTTTFSQSIIDVTNISNDKIKFEFSKSGDGQIEGNINNTNASRFSFYKLGET